MKALLSYLFLIPILFSEGSLADSLSVVVCPLELRELIDGGSTSCEETYPLARPFLDKAASQRLEKSNKFLGDLLFASIRKDLSAMANTDQIYHNLGLDLGPVDSCSIETIKTRLPCEVENSNLKSLTKHLPGGSINEIDDLLGMISADYKAMTVKKPESSEEMCLNSAWTTDISLQEMLLIDVDFEDFIKFLKGDLDLSRDGIKEIGKLNDHLKNNFPFFYRDLLNMKPVNISGSSLKDQLVSLLDNQEVKEHFLKSTGATCLKMIERIGGVLCSLPDNGAISNREFNLAALNYNPNDFVDGFDEFALELSGASNSEEAYANYILNCAPKCENCAPLVSMDVLLENNFDEGVEQVMFDRAIQMAQVRGQSDNKNFCPLLACENAIEAFKGEACTKRKTWRSPTEIRSLLNCPEDEMCNEDSFKSFTHVLEAQSLTGSDPRSSEARSRPRLSSFSKQFLGASADKELPAAEADQIQAVAQLESPETRVLPESDFTEARKRVEKADARSQMANQGRGNQAQGGNQRRGISPNRRGGVRDRYAGTRKQRSGDLYRGEAGEEMSEEEGYDDVLKSLIDVVRGRNDVDRLRDDLMDSSFQDIARNNQEVLSRLDASERRQGVGEGSRGGRRLANSARAGAYYDGQGPRVEGDLVPLDVELPEGEASVGENQDARDSFAPSSSASSSGRQGGFGSGGGGAAGFSGGAIAQQAVNIDFTDSQMPQYEINERALRGMNAASLRSNLRQKGIKPDKPFVMLVKDERGLIVKLPVKPLTYLGQTVFVPVIMRANAIILDLVEQSPLFRGYRDYLGTSI
jgi:hypothetical protein